MVILTWNSFIRSLKQDSLALFVSSPRILRTMVAVLLYKKSFVATVNAILLSQSIKSRIWYDSQEVVRQLDKM